MKKLLLTVILLSQIGFSQNGENSIFNEVLGNDNVNQYFQFAWGLNTQDLSFLANCDEDMLYTIFIPGEEVPNESAAPLGEGLMNPLITYINYYIHPGELILDLQNENTLLNMLDGNQAEFYHPMGYEIVDNATIDNISIVSEIPACNGIIYIIDDLLWAAPGCTDLEACNYDPDATVDDNSCDYSCLGCTDETACNYDLNVTFEDGSCIYPDMWFLDVNADGCGNSCAGDFFSLDLDGNPENGFEGILEGCDIEDLPILDIAGWPNATWADNDDCTSESIVNINGVLETHCLSINENIDLNNTLVKKIDLLGREILNTKGFQLEIYDNGTIKKKYLK